MIDVQPARTVLAWGMDDRVFPGASVEVGSSGGVVWQEACGRLTYEADSPAVSQDTIYDLASLTKVIATATVAMRLIDAGRISLDTPVRERVAAWCGADRAGVTIRDLLEHACGLPGWAPLHREIDRDAAIASIGAMRLAYVPRAQSVYSDLGFILLGHVLEAAGGSPLDRQFAAAVAPVLGSADALPLAFKPPAAWHAAMAPVRLEDDRGPVRPGETDDLNAWALGGVAGHAGMFGTARAVGSFARSVLLALRREGSPSAWIAGADLVRTFATRSTVPGSSRALAWDTMLTTSSCGTRMSPDAIGHTGFTGTSLWIDPAADVYVVFLSNRVCPRVTANDGIQAVRRALHDAILEAVRP